MTGTSATPLRATIPHDLVYWGRLPPGSWRLRAQARTYRFERLLPLPVDQIHAVGAPLAEGATLMIGIDPEQLRAHLAQRTDVGPETWELVPDGLPEHLVAAGIDATCLPHLNLLQGDFEPQPHRQLRFWRGLILHGGGLVVILLLLVAIERWSATVAAQATQLEEEGERQAARLLPPTSSDMHVELRATAELRRLESAARTSAASSVDAARALAGLWAHWPKDVRVQAEMITATTDRIVVRATVPTLADAERLARACALVDVDGISYRADPLQAQDSDRGTVVLLTLGRERAEGHKP